MKTCKKCFNYSYVFVGGEVRICPWNEIVIGNLREQNLEEIWHGDIVEEIRKEFMRGNLIGCHENTCPDCINSWDSIYATEEEMKEMYDNLPDIPEYLSLAYDERCNHACPSCRKCIMQVDQQYLDDLQTITDNIRPYVNRVKKLVTNGIGELFVAKEIVDILEHLEPEREDFSLFLETNGVLFKDNWHKIFHLSKWPITVSVTPNSFDRETYRYLAGGIDDLEKFEENLAFLTQLKHEGKITKIRMIMVVQDTNFRQMPDFVRKGIQYDVDDIVLRSLFFWFGLDEDLWLYKNVLNPCHPYHKEYLEVIKDPILKNERVLNWGYDVIQEAVSFPTLAMKRTFEISDEFEKRVIRCLDDIKPVINEKMEENKGYLIIYGVGKVGKMVLEELTCGAQRILVRGFMVENKECNPNYWMGYEVREIDEYSKFKETDTILIALTQNNQSGVRRKLEEAGYSNIIAIDEKSQECL